MIARPTNDDLDAVGERSLPREVHLLRSDNDGIAEHTRYCTGIWDAATIDRHAAAGSTART